MHPKDLLSAVRYVVQVASYTRTSLDDLTGAQYALGRVVLMAKHEIGIVYQKNSRYFIAVGEMTLVNCEKGLVTEVRPYTKYDTVRTISVEDLCEKWDITLDQFDVLMSAYLTPESADVKPRPRGSRRKKSSDDEYWRRHRTGRIARPKL